MSVLMKSPENRWLIRGAAAAVVIIAGALIWLAPASANSPGDFSLDFVASAPSTYDHVVGGGAYDDRIKNFDVVESLEAGDFQCGEIGTYLLPLTAAEG